MNHLPPLNILFNDVFFLAPNGYPMPFPYDLEEGGKGALLDHMCFRATLQYNGLYGHGALAYDACVVDVVVKMW